jgi:hypothetical protein
MLNLWRGWEIEPKQGDWSLMRTHIVEVICCGDKDLADYTIKLLAYGVQHLDRPVGVTFATQGAEGAGKGILWRNYGKLYGRHFKHISQGEHLTGRFNASLAEAIFVFLDEALWAGDRKGEQILKALTTEDTFQLERKFCDPITVKKRLRIALASNNDWIVPVGARGRRNAVQKVSDKYADENDPAHKAYWGPLQAQFGDNAPDDGRAAMLYDLLHMDLTGFNLRKVPKTAAKTEQKLLTQTGPAAWLFEVLNDGAFTFTAHGARSAAVKWTANGVEITTDNAYEAYLQFSREQREYKPLAKNAWSRKIHEILKSCISTARPRKDEWGRDCRDRVFRFRPLSECRGAFDKFVEADNIPWEPVDEEDAA